MKRVLVIAAAVFVFVDIVLVGALFLRTPSRALFDLSALLNHPQDITAAVTKAASAVPASTRQSTLHDEIMQDVPALISAVKERVNDPQSVVFRDVAAVRPNSTNSGYVLCGFTNARNALGGYGEFVPFVMAGSTMALDNPPIFDQFCNHATLIERIALH